MLHRARDKEIIKEYSYNQCLCCDCSTMGGESELLATVVSHTQWYPNTVAINNHSATLQCAFTGNSIVFHGVSKTIAIMFDYVHTSP